LTELESIADGAEKEAEKLNHASKDFERGPWLDPSNTSFGRGRRHQVLQSEVAAMAHGISNLKQTESAFAMLAEDEPASYREAMGSDDADQWKVACQNEYETLMGYHTWNLVERPPNTNVIGSRWTSG